MYEGPERKRALIGATRYVSGRPEKTAESLVVEEALQIRINGNAYTITMRTPGRDNMLAAGLLLTENIISQAEDIVGFRGYPVHGPDQTFVLDVEISAHLLAGKNLFNRSLASSASCGVCGKAELCDLVKPHRAVRISEKLDMGLIPLMLRKMQARQETFESTGGSHAAAIFDLSGELLEVQEDIGRHNAVDKAIGSMLLRGELRRSAVLFVSGRVSFEIAAKCAIAGIPFLLAVSAPSSLAVSLCSEHGITLLGFCRDNRATVYTNDHNILEERARNGKLANLSTG